MDNIRTGIWFKDFVKFTGSSSFIDEIPTNLIFEAHELRSHEFAKFLLSNSIKDPFHESNKHLVDLIQTINLYHLQMRVFYLAINTFFTSSGIQASEFNPFKDHKSNPYFITIRLKRLDYCCELLHVETKTYTHGECELPYEVYQYRVTSFDYTDYTVKESKIYEIDSPPMRFDNPISRLKFFYEYSPTINTFESHIGWLKIQLLKQITKK